MEKVQEGELVWSPDVLPSGPGLGTLGETAHLLGLWGPWIPHRPKAKALEARQERRVLRGPRVSTSPGDERHTCNKSRTPLSRGCGRGLLATEGKAPPLCPPADRCNSLNSVRLIHSCL